MAWSGFQPFDYLIWIGEAAPVILGIFVVVFTFNLFRFSLFTYYAILISCCVMLIGAHFTFTREPLFNWIRDFFGQSRNNYDKVGHFMQGVIPVLISREIFIRKNILKGYKWVSFISFCICLSTTVTYELVEFIACKIAGKTPDTFLGAQGDIWDSQWDMLFATIGGLMTIFFFNKIHDRIIEKEFPGTFEKFGRFVSETEPSPR
jgi:putative membrane protein